MSRWPGVYLSANEEEINYEFSSQNDELFNYTESHVPRDRQYIIPTEDNGSPNPKTDNHLAKQ